MPALTILDFSREHADPLADALPPLVLDRQRVIHAAAFRRLQYKTQVFVSSMADEDHYRTRLTHTLEVAQLARCIADALGLCADLAEVVALAHDLGHPPFGHAGERALEACLKDHGGFEHNTHALRVVEYLEHPYPAFRGLNLTRITRECLAKHTTQFDRPDHHPLRDVRPAPLEGQIADLADRLAYTLHDLQDGLYAGLIETAELEQLALWKAAYTGPPLASGGAWRGHLRPAIDRMQQTLLADVVAETGRAMREQGVPDLTETGQTPRAAEADRLPRETETGQTLRGMETNSTLRGTEAGSMPRGAQADLDDRAARVAAVSAAARRAGGPLARFSPDTEAKFAALETLLLHRVYKNNRLVRMDSKARRILTAVFEAYVAEPALMPRRYAQRVAEQGIWRVAADYVAGMTDRFCLSEHARLFDPRMDV